MNINTSPNRPVSPPGFHTQFVSPNNRGVPHAERLNVLELPEHSKRHHPAHHVAEPKGNLVV